ncbi:MAG: DUF2812 domain-containing protein [Chloroflexi bacterium]|nr:DUF2812 domain-containing protein [Chloroflexota bacterium]
MNPEIITKTRWFWAWQDDKEEAWLAEMAKQGYHLADLPFPSRYHFNKGEPGDYVYRLDYRPLKSKEQESYLQLFADAGWEHVGEMRGWIYFRIKATTEQTSEIFSDLESKIGKYHRVLAYLAIFLPLMVVMMTIFSSDDRSGPFFDILQSIYALIMLLLSYGIFQLFRRIDELKKKSKF